MATRKETGQSQPDGIEVVATDAEARVMEVPPLLIVETITRFMDQVGLGEGPITWERIGDGQSNITYRIRRGAQTYVLRRGPRPPLPKSTHDMLREARIQHLVSEAGVPVPKILATCDNEALLGVPFYIMEYLEGEIITDSVPVPLASMEERSRTSQAVVDVLLALHSIDVTEGELAILGKPEGYLQRQVKTFTGLWDINTQRALPAMDDLTQWISTHIPTQQASALVHGDFRMGNLMFAKDAPARVIGVLDWEMSTLGDPLADLGYLTATYSEPGEDPTVMELTSVTREKGYWRRQQILDYYASQSTLTLKQLPWYEALALWKAAVFCEAIYTRWLKGERPHDTRFGPSLEAGVPQLIERAQSFIAHG